MPEPQKCPRCGATLRPALHGLRCLRCLLETGLTSLGEEVLNDFRLPVDVIEAEQAAGVRLGELLEGRYRLARVIGDGSFGIVFEAEQQAPVRRSVALKIIRAGMDAKGVMARLEAERQTLARMDHPNVAKFLDAGTTPSGRPFFVMELIVGEPITAYCDRLQLTIPERLELVVQACRAVQHAHQKGVIHRDLKPSNILVTEQDGVSLTKVIDFGIAKVTLEPIAGRQTQITSFRVFAGTPGYMSPEQAGLDGVDVDSRSDIYSLGVLLYELLTAQKVLDSAKLDNAPLDVAIRILRENEPLRPSARIAALSVGELARVAEGRRVAPSKLAGLLKGDLDWIAMKALEKERDRRYETANGLAMDIWRHLDHEPVLASPPSRLYRFGKLFHRYRLAFVSVAAVVAALLSGLGIASWHYVLSEKARARAVANQVRAQLGADKSAQVVQFLKDMLGGVSPSVAEGRDTKLLSEILDKTSNRIGIELKNQPEVAAELNDLIGNVYQALGEYEKAEASLRAAIAIRGAAPSPDADLAAFLDDLGVVLVRRNKLPEAERLHRQALDIETNLGLSQSTQTAKFLSDLGSALWIEGKLPEAESVFRQSIALDRNLLSTNSEQFAVSVRGLGTVLAMQDKAAEAEPFFREALDIESNRQDRNDPMIARSLNNLGKDLSDQGKMAEAERVYKQALAIRRKILDPEHPDLAYSLNNLGAFLNREGKYSEAESMLREALAIRRKKLDPGHPFITLTFENLIGSLKGQGKLAEAEALQREALADLRKRHPKENPDLIHSLDALASTLGEERKFPEAESLLREAAALSRGLPGDANSELASILQQLAALLQQQRNYRDGEPVLRELLSCQKKLLATASAPTPESFQPEIITLLQLTDILLGEGKIKEAEPVARETIATAQQHLPNDWRLQEALGLLGEDLTEQRKLAEAEPLLLESYQGIQRLEAAIPDGKTTLASAARRLADFYTLANRPDDAAKWTKALQSTQSK